MESSSIRSVWQSVCLPAASQTCVHQSSQRAVPHGATSDACPGLTVRHNVAKRSTKPSARQLLRAGEKKAKNKKSIQTCRTPVNKGFQCRLLCPRHHVQLHFSVSFLCSSGPIMFLLPSHPFSFFKMQLRGISPSMTGDQACLPACLPAWPRWAQSFRENPGREKHHHGIWLSSASLQPKATHEAPGSREHSEGFRGKHLPKIVQKGFNRNPICFENEKKKKKKGKVAAFADAAQSDGEKSAIKKKKFRR